MLTITRHAPRKHYAKDGKYIGMFGPVEVTRPVKIGDRTETRRVPVLEKVRQPAVSLVRTADGKAFRQITEEKEVETQAFDEMPVVDEEGKPVKKNGKPLTVKVPKTREETVVVGAVYESRTVMEDQPVPEGAVEIPAPPQIGGYEWDGSAWVKAVKK